MVVVEIETAVLDRAKVGTPSFVDRTDVRAGCSDVAINGAPISSSTSPIGFENLSLRVSRALDPERMIGAASRSRSRRIDPPSPRRDLSRKPCRRAGRSLRSSTRRRESCARMQVELPNELRRLHRDRDARAVIDRAGPEVPGIEVAGNDHHLLRMFAAFQVADDIVARRIGQFLRRERRDASAPGLAARARRSGRRLLPSPRPPESSARRSA